MVGVDIEVVVVVEVVVVLVIVVFVVVVWCYLGAGEGLGDDSGVGWVGVGGRRGLRVRVPVFRCFGLTECLAGEILR